MPVTGVVLAGGRSSRFGTDKALAPLDGRALAAHVADALRAACDEVFAVGGDEAALTDLGLRYLDDELPGLGPLGGLVTALAHATHDWVFLAACDLPHLGPRLVSYLCRAALEAPQRYDVVAPRSKSGHEPLLSLYRRTCLAPARARIAAGTLGMRGFLGTRTVHTLDETTLAAAGIDLATATRNINHPRDLEVR